MKYIYMLLAGVLLAFILLFAVQNFRLVTVLFMNMSFTLPIAMLIILVYVLGMFTGGFVSSLLRHWIRGTTR
ncbi:MAG: DUF1049 domain-containing protein [Gammaproteobacteria bacterium]